MMIPEDECERLKVRRSLVFFACPDRDVTITCVDGSNKYPPVSVAKYRYDDTVAFVDEPARKIILAPASRVN